MSEQRYADQHGWPALKIAHKVLIAMAICCLVAVLSFAAAMRWSLQAGFLNYLQELDRENTLIILKRLEQAYNDHGSWDFVVNTPRVWPGILDPLRPENPPGQDPNLPPDETRRPRPPRAQGDRPPPRRDGDGPPQRRDGERPPPPPDGRPPNRDGGERPPPQGDPPPPRDNDGERRYSLYDTDRHCLIGPDPQHLELTYIPIKNRNQIVGWLSVAPLRTPTGNAARFVQGQMQAFYLIALLLLLLCVVLAFMLSRQLTRPIPLLARLTRHIARGDYQARVPVKGGDELAQLAHDINQMAQALESAKNNRQKFLSDVAHELRTPLTVLQGEIEAMLDGVRPITREAIVSLGHEITSLTQLVQDLRGLAKTDEGQFQVEKQKVDIRSLLEQCSQAFQAKLSQKGIELSSKWGRQPVWVYGDHQRLKQVFDNLLANAYNYTDAPGRLKIVLESQAESASVSFSDSPPGVTDEQLPLVFERLYRGDLSRKRHSTSSGLGLAIAKEIVTAHGGSIWAEHSEWGGLKIVLELPLGV